MFQSFSQTSQQFSWDALKATSDLTPHERKHLTNVYSTLTGACLSASLGAYCYLYSWLFHGGTLWFLGGLGCFLAFNFMPATRENLATRFMLLMAFSFCQGISVGPLVEYSLFIKPKALLMALVSTALVFISFSLSALTSPRRSWLYIGGLLGTGVSVLFWSSLFNMFFGSLGMFNFQLYLGLIVFSFYVIYDTQMIVEKIKFGNADFVGHSAELFVDLIAIFVRLLIILTKDKKEENERRRRR